MERWASTHWTALGYAWSRQSCDGWIPGEHLRGWGDIDATFEHPTVLTDSTFEANLIGHGDFECLLDAEAAGFIRVRMASGFDARIFALQVTFTEVGKLVAARLHQYRTNHETYDGFGLRPSDDRT